MTTDESIGRLTLLLHAALHEEAVRKYGEGIHKLDTPLVANGICFTDGQYCNIVRYQLNTTDLVEEHDYHNNVIRYKQLKLFETADHFVWDEEDRIKGFSEERFLQLAKLFQDLLHPNV